MKEDYDFSNAERGKFYRPNATLNLPVAVDPDVVELIDQSAEHKNIECNESIDPLLKKQQEIIEP